MAFDANSTLRVSFGHVQGYSPRDGVVYVAPDHHRWGSSRREPAKDPFVVPRGGARSRRRARRPLEGPRALGDVPDRASWADADTTGGNSGSPVIDGKGQLVGVNFDRVWENVANDFGFNPTVARNVSVDVRYLLWMLEEVEGAGALLEELGVSGERRLSSPAGGAPRDDRGTQRSGWRTKKLRTISSTVGSAGSFFHSSRYSARRGRRPRRAGTAAAPATRRRT